MSRRAWAKAALAAVVTGGVVVAMSHLDDAPVLPEPQDPYRDVTLCRSRPYGMALVDANGDAYPDIAVLCGNELLTVSGVDGDSLWRHDFGDGMTDPLGARGWPALVADDRNHLIVGHHGAIVSVAAETGKTRWSRQLDDWTPDLEVADGCLIAEGAGRPGSPGRQLLRLSLESGEPSSCNIRMQSKAVDSGLELSQKYVDRERPEGSSGDVITLSRRGKAVWSVACDDASICSSELTPAGVVVWGRELDRRSREQKARRWPPPGPATFARVHDLHTGKVVRVLEPPDMGASFRSLPPYLIATRGHRRPILEVFLATSLVPLWRSDRDDPPMKWRRIDELTPVEAPGTDPGPGSLSEAPAVVELPCSTGITPRPAIGRDDVAIRMERTGCFGSCPAYVVTIFGNGRVEFDSLSMAEAPGGQLTPAELDELVGRFHDNGFFDMCDKTKRWRTHFPSMNLELWDGARVKRVETYLGNWSTTAPVRELGAAVDRAVGIEHKDDVVSGVRSYTVVDSPEP